MTEEIIDDERLSALLAGRVGRRERNRLLAHLASDQSGDYEVFAAAASILHEMEAEDKDQDCTPTAMSRRLTRRRADQSVPTDTLVE